MQWRVLGGEESMRVKENTRNGQHKERKYTELAKNSHYYRLCILGAEPQNLRA